MTRLTLAVASSNRSVLSDATGIAPVRALARAPTLLSGAGGARVAAVRQLPFDETHIAPVRAPADAPASSRATCSARFISRFILFGFFWVAVCCLSACKTL